MMLTFLFFSFCILNVNAQDSSHTNANSGFTVYQDPKISELQSKYIEYNKKKEFSEGYRIQINYTDIRDEIYRNKGSMYKEFPEIESYVEYEQPYYKLRIGDFKTRLEATYYLQKVVTIYPGAFIVRDKIKAR